MKKSGVFLAAVAVCMILLTGTAFAAVEFKFAHSGSLEHQYQIGAEQFKKLVEEKSGGEMKVTIFPQAQLGGERDLAEGVRMGTIEMSSVAAGNMAGFVPELQVCLSSSRPGSRSMPSLTAPWARTWRTSCSARVS
jgi:TRAP-type C4-dicarboxylate transport system substrate-binding protein